MLCQKCGKNTATTHIKTVINGAVTEQSLCGYCAAKYGYSPFSSAPISNLLASMLGQTMKNGAEITSRRCVCCNATFADIAETGKVGCAECYKEFGKELLPYLKRIHGSVNHMGKTPGTKELIVKDQVETLADLKAKLATLVAAEKYEEAAVVRDEIRKMEGKE